MNPIVMYVWAEPRGEGFSKKFANSNGLVVQLGEAEEFTLQGKEVVL